MPSMYQEPPFKGEDKELYTKDEVLEIIRRVLYTGTPGLYENGGIYGGMKRTDTFKRAKEAFEKYYLKHHESNT